MWDSLINLTGESLLSRFVVHLFVQWKGVAPPSSSTRSLTVVLQDWAFIYDELESAVSGTLVEFWSILAGQNGVQRCIRTRIK